MRHKAHERVYRIRSQSFIMVMCILANDVLIGAGVARNISRTSLAAGGIAWIVIFTAVAARAAAAGIVASSTGIHVRNVFSSRDFRWDEIDRLEIDTPGGGLFPQICRVYTKNGQMRRAIGITETNVALTRPMEKRPAARMVAELNEALKDPAKRSAASKKAVSIGAALRLLRDGNRAHREVDYEGRNGRGEPDAALTELGCRDGARLPVKEGRWR